MNSTLTVELPEEVKATLGTAAREEGVSVNAFDGIVFFESDACHFGIYS